MAIDMQATLFEQSAIRKSPTNARDEEATEIAKAPEQALSELFSLAQLYRTSKAYKELLRFVARFRFYSPFNALLVNVQMPGATFVAPAYRWANKYGRLPKPDARPLIILQPKGPVMFVFDVGQTEPGPKARPLPPEVENPFEVRGGYVDEQLECTKENAKRDGVRIHMRPEGSQSAGSIRDVGGDNLPVLRFQTRTDVNGDPIFETIPVRYDLLINEKLGREAQYASLVHELGHLYCGHLGTPNKKWWTDRSRSSHVVSEFEAETVSYFVCKRLGIDSPSDEYLADYLEKNQEVPNISLECVMKAAGLIEQMGKRRLKPRRVRPVMEAGL